MIDKKYVFLLGIWCGIPLEAGAIPPPDILLSGLQSVIQLFGVIAVFCVSLFFIAKDFFQNLWLTHRRKCLLGGGGLVISLLFLIGYFIYETF